MMQIIIEAALPCPPILPQENFLPTIQILSPNFLDNQSLKMHLMYTVDTKGKRIYTLKKITSAGAVTKSAHPARFSPDDKYSR